MASPPRDWQNYAGAFVFERIGTDNGNYRRQSVCRPFAVIRELIMLLDVRYWSNSGQRSILAGHGLSAFDPTATLQSRRCSPVNAAGWRYAVPVKALLD